MGPALLGALLAGCAGVSASTFSLEDVNPTSPLYGQQVAPADFEGQVSAWYFGHAT
jgi:hypothetical protein